MRLLLDECVPRRLRREFPGHETVTVEDAGVKGLKNGKLLRTISGSIDVLVTVDQNLPNQQNLQPLDIAILILVAKSNRYDTLRPLIPQALRALERLGPGQVARVEATQEGDTP